MKKQILTSYDVANSCHVDIKTVANWTADGSLKAYKTKGGHRRIKKDDLEEFLEEHKMPIPLKRRILIVDDDASIRMALKDFFESKGYVADEADDGFKAGVIFKTTKPEVVIMDIIMSGMDGITACKHIREAEGTKNTKIVVLTGYPSKENFKKAKKAGADKCLAKPIKNEELLIEVEKLVGTDSNG